MFVFFVVRYRVVRPIIDVHIDFALRNFDEQVVAVGTPRPSVRAYMVIEIVMIITLVKVAKIDEPPRLGYVFPPPGFGVESSHERLSNEVGAKPDNVARQGVSAVVLTVPFIDVSNGVWSKTFGIETIIVLTDNKVADVDERGRVLELEEDVIAVFVKLVATFMILVFALPLRNLNVPV